MPRVMRSMLAGAVMGLLAATASAAPPPQAQREVEQLIEALGRSGCEFQRNGSWYPANEAQAHLRRKYDYLRNRDLVDSAEQFIERAGTQSSMSGKAYAVRCPGQGTVPSAQWLGARLSKLRHATP
ncbi:DUF5329 domain-containing protein [Lysobacter sp. UC]|uniref:DUF5329 domain-containing protein n=2 Tax=Lysobacter arvi TaxID=3038776 RepID=A0ABU1CB43_9GAMM|nr:DUF5329 domain-containing protein [Lysobacter arvi]MDR0182363.1 DUF5329 domain-containing protein [Lysobacter arvi]